MVGREWLLSVELSDPRSRPRADIYGRIPSGHYTIYHRVATPTPTPTHRIGMRRLEQSFHRFRSVEIRPVSDLVCSNIAIR